MRDKAHKVASYLSCVCVCVCVIKPTQLPAIYRACVRVCVCVCVLCVCLCVYACVHELCMYNIMCSLQVLPDVPLNTVIAEHKARKESGEDY